MEHLGSGWDFVKHLIFDLCANMVSRCIRWAWEWIIVCSCMGCIFSMMVLVAPFSGWKIASPWFFTKSIGKKWFVQGICHPCFVEEISRGIKNLCVKPPPSRGCTKKKNTTRWDPAGPKLQVYTMWIFPLPSLKLTWNLKIDHLERRFLLENTIFRCYVSSTEGKMRDSWQHQLTGPMGLLLITHVFQPSGAWCRFLVNSTMTNLYSMSGENNHCCPWQGEIFGMFLLPTKC